MFEVPARATDDQAGLVGKPQDSKAKSRPLCGFDFTVKNL